MKRTNSFSQSMPNGDEERNIPALLRRIADTLSGMDDIAIQHITLDNAQAADEKPSFAVYYDSTLSSSESDYKPAVLTVKLGSGDHQNDIIALLRKMTEEIARIRPREIFNMVVENEIDELGDHYKATVYYDPKR